MAILGNIIEFNRGSVENDTYHRVAAVNAVGEGPLMDVHIATPTAEGGNDGSDRGVMFP